MKSMFLSLERRQTCFAISCVCNLLKFSSIEGALEENIHAKVYLQSVLIVGQLSSSSTNGGKPITCYKWASELKRIHSHYNIWSSYEYHNGNDRHPYLPHDTWHPHLTILHQIWVSFKMSNWTRSTSKNNHFMQTKGIGESFPADCEGSSLESLWQARLRIPCYYMSIIIRCLLINVMIESSHGNS